MQSVFNKFFEIKRVVLNDFFLCIAGIFHRIKIMRKYPCIKFLTKPRLYITYFF